MAATPFLPPSGRDPSSDAHGVTDTPTAAASMPAVSLADNPLPVWIVDRTTLEFLAVNPAAVRRYGYSADEFLARRLPDLVPEEDRLRLAAHVARTFGREPDSHPWRHCRKDGSVVPAGMFSHDVDFGGRPARLIVSVDETREDVALGALRTSETRFRALSESAPLGIFETDPAGRCTYCNPAMGDILERPISQLLGFGWARTIHPEDRDFLRECWTTAVSEGVRWGGEVRLHGGDRGMRWIRGAIAPQKDDEGRVCSVVGTIEDVTASRHAEIALLESEERFKLAARAVSDVIWDLDLLTNQLWRSESYDTIFGVEADARWEDRLHPDDRDRVVTVIAQAQAGSASSWAQEYRYRRRDGTYAHVHDRAQILRDPAGRAVRMIGGMTDLSERKKLEAQYLRSQRMESIGTLAGGIAHDLNNVLTPILMSINLLRPSVRHDRMALDILTTVETSTRRGADLVRQVLSFARGFGGGRATINLRHLIKEVIRIGGEAFPPSIRVVADCQKNLWLVSGDATQLHQVLMNLAVNARDAMPDGGTLTFSATNLVIDDAYVGLHPEAKPGPHVLLKVSDTGSGIPPEIVDRIFEPFFTTKEVGQGTGLGLSTVHAIVKGHEGFVSVYSEPGRGTTFQVHLPADPKLNPGAPPPSPAEFPRGRGECILIIDDEASIRSMSQQALEAFGYQVVAAADGAQGVALFAAQPHRFDAVLTDMLMPVMDGATAIQAIVRLRPDVRVIAASGLDANSNIARAAAAGVRHFLPKPYTAEAMLRLVRTALDEPAGASSPVPG